MEGDKIALELAEQVHRYLADLEFPANKSEIVEHARAHRADSALLAALSALPDGRYDHATEVAERVGGTPEDNPAKR